MIDDSLHGLYRGRETFNCYKEICGKARSFTRENPEGNKTGALLVVSSAIDGNVIYAAAQELEREMLKSYLENGPPGPYHGPSASSIVAYSLAMRGLDWYVCC